jgi:hypothetical protein
MAVEICSELVHSLSSFTGNGETTDGHTSTKILSRDVIFLLTRLLPFARIRKLSRIWQAIDENRWCSSVRMDFVDKVVCAPEPSVRSIRGALAFSITMSCCHWPECCTTHWNVEPTWKCPYFKILKTSDDDDDKAF